MPTAHIIVSDSKCNAQVRDLKLIAVGKFMFRSKIVYGKSTITVISFVGTNMSATILICG